MWLFTRFGFFSAVACKWNARSVQIRARIREDLEMLSRFAIQTINLELGDIVETPETDYRFRSVVSKETWILLMRALAENVDYTNFKDTIHGEPDRDDAYLKVWNEMAKLQDKRRKSPSAIGAEISKRRGTSQL